MSGLSASRGRTACIVVGLAIAAMTGPALAGRTIDCPMERAVYAVPGHEGHELHFLPAAEPDAFSAIETRLDSSLTGFSYAFAYTVSMGYATEYLVPEAQPPRVSEGAAGQGLALYFFDTDLAPSWLAGEGEPAPPYLFVPELGRFLWYDVTLDGDREALPTAIWHLSGCR